METDLSGYDQPLESSPESPGSRPPSTRKGEHRSEREKRTYRACLHCRQRKSRCDLYSSGEPGRPPCERCIREQHECILGGSRRGGRRVKRSATDLASTTSEPPGQTPSDIDGTNKSVSFAAPRLDQQQPLPNWSPINPGSRTLPPLTHDGTVTPTAKMSVDVKVASTDLQNPADALEFLAHVAERDSGRDSVSTQLPPMQTPLYGRSSINALMNYEEPRSANATAPSNVINFPPLVNGLLTYEIIQTLLLRYEDKYHSFFPLANPSVMDPSNLRESAAKEPHLLAAILTVASKDEKDWCQIHQHCSGHMQSLVASLVYTGCGTVEAVEAMLILAEWVPRRPRATSGIGRGEEDQAAWMYVGTAIRLGYLLGIDRTGFRAEGDAQSLEFNRKRLAWATSYICDRSISVRIGKAFWSRGPGPMTSLRAQDFPSLQSRLHPQDNFGAIFQANLELTQLFSNAHDVLYATKSRSQQLNFGGEYVKYIDDFRVSLRHWNEAWGVFTCSPPLKASLILSYEYIRLYVNAFAYQATLNRLTSQMQAGTANGQGTRTPTPFSDVAATPDARFIYDAIDAAKALLSTFCSFVDPVETFRFMPLRYYLYVIYSAVFLYKARATGVMGGDTRGSVKSLISNTMANLQKSSACANDVGDRYSRLIRLLWRKPPGRGARNSIIEDPGESTRLPSVQAGVPDVAGAGDLNNPMDLQAPSINTFSWLDLGAVGDFAVENNNSVSESMMDNLDRFDDSSADGYSQFGYDPPLMPQPYWYGMSPSGVIF